MLFPKYNYKKEVLPFLIEWESENQISSLFNPQAITKVNYGNMDIKRFRHIYQLKPRKLLKNRVILYNAKIFLTKDGGLDFDLDKINHHAYCTWRFLCKTINIPKNNRYFN